MVIVDTSVVIKWFFPEEGSEAARSLLKEESLGAPDLLLYEFVNFLVCQPELTFGDVTKFLNLLYQSGVQFFVLPQRGFHRTLELSRKYKLTAYDASFVALAESLHSDFVTADGKMARKVQSLSFVRELG